MGRHVGGAIPYLRPKTHVSGNTGEAPTPSISPPAALLTTSVIPVPPEPYFAHRYFMPGNFTGRVAERKELTEWFADTHHPMFIYEAIGGMGKSAVTWYWLHEDVLNSDPKPDGVIWWSFYEKESRFETFLEKTLIYLTGDEPRVKGIPSTYDRMQWLCQLLCKKRYLIILDGAERILRAYAGLGSPYQGDEVPEDKKDDYCTCIDPNAGNFLQWLTSSDIKSKILITSRLFPRELDGLDDCRHRKLVELQKADAVEFYQQPEKQTDGKELRIIGTRAEIEAACEKYGCHPLSLRLLRGMIFRDLEHPRDIVTWTEHNPLPQEIPREHHILELAYNSLDEKKRKLISELAAFRNPMAYDSMVIFRKDFGDQQEFDTALIDLVDRGLLLRDLATNKYDLHPIIRRYCYDRLTDKQGVHSQLRDYFTTVPSKKEEEIESLADLDPVIELYHHTVNSGQYDEAFRLFYDRITYATYFRFGAYSLRIDLLRLLLPDEGDKPPRLNGEAAQAWTLNGLANSYALSGQPRKAIPLFQSSNDVDEKSAHSLGVAIGLGNLAYMAELQLGRLDSAELNLRRCISISQKINSAHQESAGHRELGRLLDYRGRFKESAEELSKALEGFEKLQAKQSEGLVWSHRALRMLLMSDPRQALEHAQRAREMADAEHYEADIIRAEWLLGAVYLANGNLKEAESHLNEALLRDRRINLVEFEASILLELAKLRHAQRHKRDEILK
ncbi:MAG: tetratricopeptide repeat protein, partial [candidate division Zixibacteria bacterium]|nr:tetratricopeptide repeat protein [candidate division Zixibacteria bacterium]